MYKDLDKNREYQRNWRANRRKQWLVDNGPCKKCGSNENLEIDHIDPKQKKHSISTIWSHVNRHTELAKCQVLCKTCHLKKTSEYRMPEHGTNSRYQRGCKCEPCKADHARVNRKYR